MDALLTAARSLRDTVDRLRFADPVHTVYNPLDYAWNLHAQYVTRFAQVGVDAVLLGMNPGPFGMAQTGVPFGEVTLVREWMGLSGSVQQPTTVHPKRPIQGLACTKSEVSGRRLWGLFQQHYGTPEHCFAQLFVANYCPLVFMSASGSNLTPDKLPASERTPLESACDAHLVALVRALAPRLVIGVGGFAQKRAQTALTAAGITTKVATILHPSPASPAANRGWAEQAARQLIGLGVWSAS